MSQEITETTYRTYRAEDFEAVRRLHFEGLKEFGYRMEDMSEWDADLRQMDEVYLKNGGFWVAEAEGKLVGMVGIARLDEETAELRRMRVDRDWRRHGIATRLCEMAEQFCRAHGVGRIQLLTESQMQAAQRLYEKLGYGLARVDHHDLYESRWYVKEVTPAGQISTTPPGPLSARKEGGAQDWQGILRREAHHLALLYSEWEERSPIELTDEQISKLECYMALLLERNRQFNLTAITEPREIAIKHFYDSLTALTAIYPTETAEVLDIGAGAGFPGVVLALLRPDIEVTLLDSILKITRFLEELAAALELTNVRVVRGRAEELAREPEWKGRFDFAVVRAVGEIAKVAKWSRDLLKPGGELLLMKGPRGEEELAQSRSRLERLGFRISHTITLWLPEETGERKLVVVEKK